MQLLRSWIQNILTPSTSYLGILLWSKKKCSLNKVASKMAVKVLYTLNITRKFCPGVP